MKHKQPKQPKPSAPNPERNPTLSPNIFSPNVILPIATILFLAVYLLTLQPLFGVLCIASFLAYVVLDLVSNKQKKQKHLAIEVIYAIVGAALVWITLSIALQTPSPLDVVTSCSMRPSLDRGDLVVVQGKTLYNAPVIEFQNQMPQIAVTRENCTLSKRGFNTTIAQCSYALNLSNNSNDFSVPISRTDVANNDVIIYDSRELGLIIHRVALVLKNTSSSTLVYLTKGDNNQLSDQEAGISFVSQQQIHGKMLFKVPLIGYLRLFLAGQFKEPPGCDTMVDAP